MKQHHNFNLLYFFLALWGVFIIQNLWVSMEKISSIPYSQFQELVHSGGIKEVEITSDYIRGALFQSLNDGNDRFVTVRVKGDIAKELGAAGIKFSRKIESTLFRDLLSWIVPAIVFFGIWFLIIRRLGKSEIGGQFMSIGKSKAKVYVEDDTRTTFEDVAGIDEAKAELNEVVEFLKDRDRYGRLGGRMPKGILLVGPPGTGKTLLARAVAGEAGVPFFSISGSEFVEMFVGVGAARVRDLFEQARQKAPCIIFIDELDALGRSRSGVNMGGGHDEKEQTLNQLLSELDGFDSRSGTVLLGATNRPEVLDPALLRAGRFDRQVLVDRPDKRGRVDILAVHVKGITLGSEVALEEVAALTPGFTGADLANLVNEAALAATRREATTVQIEDFTTAIERLLAGLARKSRILNPFERTVVAHHEMGHALVAAAMPGTDIVHKVSIIPHGIGALGYTMQRPIEDRHLMVKQELEQRMAVLMGGRAAEQLIFGHLSTGAADDLVKTTDIAKSMVSRYGMDETLGSVIYDKAPGTFLGTSGQYEAKDYSEETAQLIDEAVRKLVDTALAQALTILTAHKQILEQSAQKLLEKETLDQTGLTEYFSKVRKEYAQPVSICLPL